MCGRVTYRRPAGTYRGSKAKVKATRKPLNICVTAFNTKHRDWNWGLGLSRDICLVWSQTNIGIAVIHKT